MSPVAPFLVLALFIFLVRIVKAAASASALFFPEPVPVTIMPRPLWTGATTGGLPIWASATGAGLAKRASSAMARVENIGRSVFMVVMFCGFVGDGIEPPLDGRIAPFVGELACLCGVLRSP
jgi:hypothetical protein